MIEAATIGRTTAPISELIPSSVMPCTTRRPYAAPKRGPMVSPAAAAVRLI